MSAENEIEMIATIRNEGESQENGAYLAESSLGVEARAETYKEVLIAAAKAQIEYVETIRKMPLQGWPEDLIKEFVHQLLSADSSNFPNKLGFGEREARIYSSLVATRHYSFGHGIGRSGNLTEAQPKAAGSTIMSNLTNSLLLDLFRSIGLQSTERCFIVPMATDMTLMLCMLSFKKQRPNAKYVLWSRIDQKSCFKSITSAGLTPIVIEPELVNSLEGGKRSTIVLRCDECIFKKGSENILCILSTTSCFAPRNADDVIELSGLAEEHEIPHLVNNAYGLQCKSITKALERAQSKGRVDLFVQSTDENLLLPVGGAIVASSKIENVENVAKTYAGRASSSQTLDVLMTLLSLGKQGYQELLDKRLEDFQELRKQLLLFARANNTKLLNTTHNDISIALDLKHLGNVDHTEFGSMLYSRGVFGARVVVSGDTKIIDGYEFKNWGAHHSDFKGAYLTLAATISVDALKIPILIKTLQECTNLFLKKQIKHSDVKTGLEETVEALSEKLHI